MKVTIVLLSLVALATTATAAKTEEKVQDLPEIRTLWDFQDLEATETRFRELLPKAIEQGDSSYFIQLQTQIARTYGLRMKYEEAHKILDEAESLLSDEMVVPRIRYLLERGRVYNSSQEKEKAKPLFVEAWEFALANEEDAFAIDAAHMMGIAETPDKQIEWSLKAMNLAEKSTDENARNWLGPLYNNTGWSYFDLEEYEKALELFRKGLRWRKEKNDEAGIRIQTWNIGRTYRALGNIDKAFEVQRELKKEFDEKELTDSYWSGYNLEELGELYLLKGGEEEAGEYFKRAYEILSQDEWLVTHEPERIKRLKELGGVKE